MRMKKTAMKSGSKKTDQNQKKSWVWVATAQLCVHLREWSVCVCLLQTCKLVVFTSYLSYKLSGPSGNWWFFVVHQHPGTRHPERSLVDGFGTSFLFGATQPVPQRNTPGEIWKLCAWKFTMMKIEDVSMRISIDHETRQGFWMVFLVIMCVGISEKTFVSEPYCITLQWTWESIAMSKCLPSWEWCRHEL